jgi:putative transcriptional regulator
MSLRKCCFTTLATIAIFSAVRTLQVHCMDFDADSQPHDIEFALNDSLSLVLHANQRVRSHSIFAAEREDSQTALPVQSKNPDDLGVGKLLVASRDLADPIFAKTVVLLVHSDTDGVVGLMLNRRSDVPLSRVFKELKAAKDRSDPVYLGGPVEISSVLALLRSKANQESAEHILGDVYLISTKSLLEKTLSAKADPGVFHVFLGYAGWSPEQLRNEVKVGAWFIFRGDAQTVFNSNPDGLWSQMIRRTELKMASSRRADAVMIQQSWANTGNAF